jgi:hypothetical protein
MEKSDLSSDFQLDCSDLAANQEQYIPVLVDNSHSVLSVPASVEFVVSCDNICDPSVN